MGLGPGSLVGLKLLQAEKLKTNKPKISWFRLKWNEENIFMND
jgi:hypothetical protein